MPRAHRRDDEELYQALRQTGFQGSAYNVFVADATDYASGWLWKQVRSGEIFNYLQKIDRPRPRLVQWPLQDLEVLIRESVHDGYMDFHIEVLVRGHWDPQKAALRTVLVRYCAARFADHYEKWRSSFRLIAEAGRDPTQHCAQHAPSAERVALARYELGQVAPEQLGKAVGYTHQEIGQMLGITARAVGYRLQRGGKQ